MKEKSAYTESGVDIDAADEAVALMKEHVESTYTPDVLSNVGAFGGLIDASPLKKYKNPVLVPSIDGAGTKPKIAEKMNLWTIGQDIVNHCVNDILTLGAIPFFFLDYVAAAKLKPEIMGEIVENMAISCRQVGIPLISGETAEMPGVYQKGQHEIVGSIVGVVEKYKIINGSKITSGDVLIGLRSNGLHTNGYSLAIKAFFETLKWNVKSPFEKVQGVTTTIGTELLKVHLCYLNPVSRVLDLVHGIAHITGGGLIENIGRLLPAGLCAEISQKWKIPRVFEAIQNIENVSDEEMRRVFNLGIGMVLIVPLDNVDAARHLLMCGGESDHIMIGTIKKADPQRKEKVIFTF